MPPPRRIAIVAYPGVQALDVTGPHEVFAGAAGALRRRREGPAPYEVVVASVAGGPVTSESGLAIVTTPLADVIEVDTLVVAGGSGVLTACEDGALVAA